MSIVADLHLHSKYSRAVSPKMVLPTMAEMAEKKGIDLLATGDFTHPLWVKELESQLQETVEGIYILKEDGNKKRKTRYILGTEISCIYSQGGKGRRVHVLVFAPNLEIVDKINQAMKEKGCNLMSDGRPIIGLSVIELSQLLFEIDENIVVIPAHVWTPWFSLYGSKSGFDSIEECFGEFAGKIYAVETGLSCYDEETEVLTDSGWKKFSKIHYSDKICTLNIATEKIEYQKPQRIFTSGYEGRMYRLKTKRVDLLVTPNHKLLFSPCDFRKPPRFSLKEATFLFNKSKRFKKDGIWIGRDEKYFVLPDVKIRHGSRYYSGLRNKKEKQFQ